MGFKVQGLGLGFRFRERAFGILGFRGWGGLQIGLHAQGSEGRDQQFEGYSEPCIFAFVCESTAAVFFYKFSAGQFSKVCESQPLPTLTFPEEVPM